MYDLSGKVVLVTGAGGEHGIGRRIALRLAENGAAFLTGLSVPVTGGSFMH